jgi:hypothetical protein
MCSSSSNSSRNRMDRPAWLWGGGGGGTYVDVRPIHNRGREGMQVRGGALLEK